MDEHRKNKTNNRKEGEAETIEGAEEAPPVLGETAMLKLQAIGGTYTAITVRIDQGKKKCVEEISYQVFLTEPS